MTGYNAGGGRVIILRAWLTARTWREFGYLITGVLVAAPPFVLGLLSIVAVLSSTVPLGLPILVGVLALARHIPRWFRGHAHWFLGRRWDDPPPLPAGTLWQRSLALLRDPAAWRSLGYCLARWPLTLVGVYPAALGLIAGGSALTYPLWWFVTPTGLGAFDADTWAGTWLVAPAGALLLLAVPWWLRLVVWTDGVLVRTLLHPSRSQRRIAELEAGRAALQADAAALLRRIERDLHDGTQARLVTLGVALSRIEHRSTEEAVRALATDARGTVTEALAELRDIVRGMHPPALDDGLEVALATLAGRSAVPAEVTVALAARPPDATASALYFAVAELLTNVARHGRASRVRIDLRTDQTRLLLTVTDDGRGGARIDSTGTGLAGLARRASALDGTLTVDSPPGGPTTVTMTLPVEA
ncbi:sensor histidine kinase [Actinoplanes sp. NPDC049668]|uniref:sensor histidine kinase n=1 Tax=unclassified Actinoplanes TaxID=2626549 RepID=UPI0033BF662E